MIRTLLIHGRFLLLAGLLILLHPRGAWSAVDGPVPEGSPAPWRWELGPKEQLYPPYLADPRRPRMRIGAGLFDTEIPQTSSRRYLIDLGTRFTLLTLRPDPQGTGAFSIDLEGGLFTQFDQGNQLDSLGWDGVVGTYAVYDINGRVSVRVGNKHLSSHLGDEYVENTGKRRVGYTRAGLTLGVAWRLANGITVYLEPDWAYHMGNPQRQRRWSLEGGVQYEGPFDSWTRKAAFHAGIHLRAFEEEDWSPGVSGEIGCLVRPNPHGSKVRLGLEAYRGRAILGEFALDFDETYLSAGLTFEFN